MSRGLGSALAGALVLVAASGPTGEAEGRGPSCPPAMALVDDAYCIDRWEASLVEVTARGDAPFSPFATVAGHKVKAVSRAGVVPQAYISRDEAEAACRAARKRLCTEDEWGHACRGRKPTRFPYGDERKAGYCNDAGRSPLAVLYASAGDDMFRPAAMNDPRLNQLAGTIARTGSHKRCASSYGVFDMVGNVHEWVDDAAGTFRGGYYLDTQKNGDGCDYRTIAHDAGYHDYSTGFRCCADARGARRNPAARR